MSLDIDDLLFPITACISMLRPYLNVTWFAWQSLHVSTTFSKCVYKSTSMSDKIAFGLVFMSPQWLVLTSFMHGV